MSTPVATSTPARPKRRWYQFSLRTMLALTTLFCTWLGYNAWEYRKETAIIAHLESLDCEPEVSWSTPAWWRAIFGERSAGIFDRVERLTIEADGLRPRDLAEIHLEQLSWLTHLTVANRDYSVEMDEVLAGMPRNVVITDFLDNRSPWLEYPLEEYQRQPTPAKAKALRRAILRCQRDKLLFPVTPNELWSFGRPLELDDGEERSLIQILEFSDKSLAALAAETLWKAHSRVYARKVIEFARQSDAQSRQEHKYLDQIEGDIEPDRILEVILHGDLDWGAWLASLLPDPQLTAALIRTIDEGRGTPGAVHALGKSKDPQVVPTLIKALSDPGLSEGDVAERSLLYYTGKSVEVQLIDALPDGNSLFVENAAEILAKTGSSRALPALRQLNEDWKMLPTTLLYRRNFVARAIAKIEDRTPKGAQRQPTDQQ